MLFRFFSHLVSRLSTPPRSSDTAAGSIDIATADAQSDEEFRESPQSPGEFQSSAQELADTGNLRAASETYLAGIKVHPGNAALRVNASNVFKSLGQLALAREHLEEAVRLAPELAAAWYNLGILLQETWWIEEALDALGHAYRLEQVNGPTDLCKNLVQSIGLALQQSGQWQRSRQFLIEASSAMPTLAADCERLSLSTWVQDDTATPEDKLAAHASWAEKYADPLLPRLLRHNNDRDPDRPLKVGYVSGDFRAHAVSYFFEPLLKNHDRKAYRVICYDNTHKPDEVTESIRHLSAEWRLVSALSDEALAQKIREDSIDILVDLSGHTAFNRLNMFARKPAPIQITWLGSPMTTGMAAMDYRISDKSIDPPGISDHWYRERILRLRGSPWCFGKPHHSPAVSTLPLRTHGHLTFGSFNQVYKLTDQVLDVWAAILRQLPDSRMVMVSIPRGRYRDRLLEKFQRAGIDSRRIDLYGYVRREQFLTIHGSVDIALDPFPCNGGTTTCESLWMGVPVVVMEGIANLSRAGVSLLQAANLGDWIAADRDSYIELAVEKSTQPELLARLRENMRASLLDSPLMDAPLFAETFEEALRSVWREWCVTH